MAIGDFREGLARLHHHHLLGQGSRRLEQDQRHRCTKDQGSKGAAHGFHGSLGEP